MKKALEKKVSQPDFIEPMLATLTDKYFSSNDWLYEQKFDGERCLAFKKNGSVRLLSRNNKLVNTNYPELVDALMQQKADNFIIDGEIVSLNPQGISDFELLQGRMNLQKTQEIQLKEKAVKIHYCIFDLIYTDGRDIRQMPLLERKKLLKKLLNYNKTLEYSEHIIGDGLTFFKKACGQKWEGVIAKRIDSEYVGVRSRDWLKFKCIMQQELIICGYTAPQGSRSYFGALLVGYYDKDKLIYAGKVGTGYTQDTLETLGKKLQKLIIKKCPYTLYDGPTKDITWVKPELVAEFQFANWTNAGKLRVGRYKGLRDDKAAKDVVQETVKPIGPR